MYGERSFVGVGEVSAACEGDDGDNEVEPGKGGEWYERTTRVRVMERSSGGRREMGLLGVAVNSSSTVMIALTSSRVVAVSWLHMSEICEGDIVG